MTNKFLADWVKKYLQTVNDALAECRKLGIDVPDATISANDTQHPIDDAALNGIDPTVPQNAPTVEKAINSVPDAGNKNCIKVLLTDATMQGAGEEGASRQGLGIIMGASPGAPEDYYVLAHELGHFAGYDCGDAPPEKSHSSKRDNIMYTAANTHEAPAEVRHPDECWCKKMASLAKK
jgi:hypothetical protein